MGLKSVTFILLISLTISIDSARILGVFPVASISHQVVFRSLTVELAKRGHEVVVITTDPAFENGKQPANFTEIDVHDVSYKIWKERLDSVNGAAPHIITKTVLHLMVDVVKVQLETPQMKEFMKKEQHFDLVIAEACVSTALGFAHKFKAPVIQMSSFYGTAVNYHNMGAPTHMFLYPDIYILKIRDLTVLDKVLQVIIKAAMRFAYSNYLKEVDATLKKYFGEDTPTIHELESKIDMLFLNTNPIWEGIRPVPPGIVFLGGLHMQPVKELPKDLKSYLDSSKGVIYVSFGTNFSPSSLSKERIRVLFTVFSTLPYDILCKWDHDDVPGRPGNVRIVKWAPQNDLLMLRQLEYPNIESLFSGHPNIKLFITQGGMQSTDEAIAAGVPLIGIPILVDQFFNTEKYIQHQIGEKLNLEKMTEEELHGTILKVLNNDSYRKNIIKLRELMRDQINQPLERAVWWTEHVLRHGGAKHLRAPAANMSFAEYYELELVAVLIAIFAVIVGVFVGFFYLLARLVRKLFSKPHMKKD